ncbi:GNAT family N-acetyltransferase [Geminicoccaceae bacterium 1502E]|nr:GNAT family N-acetyltransferase [Geminicoccaceae bacterium 1502E]
MPESDVNIIVAASPAALLEHREAWHDLAANAIESNVFYEPDPLLLALGTLPPGEAWRIVLVYRQDALIGLFPMRWRRIAGTGLHLVAELLRHGQSFFHVPLLRREAGTIAVRAWLDWCSRSGAPLVVCPRITGDGAVAALLRDELAALGGSFLEHDRYMRPVMIPGADAESYLREALGGDRRRELRRQRRLLEAHGDLVFTWPSAIDDPAAWATDFLALERRGWKGKDGGALACDAGRELGFRELLAALHARRQALLFGARLNGAWIAMSCILRVAPPGTGAFAFKTAYDEDLRRFAPAIMLESAFLGELHGTFRDVGWVDSCTSPGKNTAIGKLWAGRRAIAHLVLAMPGLRGTLALAAYRLMMRRAARRAVPAAGK